MARSFSLRLLAGVSCLAAAVAAGCGPGLGTVSGTVTFKEKPVTSGSVSVIASDGIQYVGEITPQGTYSIPRVPAGNAKFTVASPNPNHAAAGRVAGNAGGAASGDAAAPAPAPNPPAAGTWVALPPEYADPAKSNLTGTVTGDTVINLPLK